MVKETPDQKPESNEEPERENGRDSIPNQNQSNDHSDDGEQLWRKLTRDLLVQHWAMLKSEGYQSQRSLDNAITMIATGALIISINFAKDFSHTSDFGLLKISWFAFLLSIIVQTLSFKNSIRAFDDSKIDVEADLGAWCNPQTYDVCTGDKDHGTSGKYSITTVRLNRASYYATAIGLVLLVLFAFKNIPGNFKKETAIVNPCCEFQTTCQCKGGNMNEFNREGRKDEGTIPQGLPLIEPAPGQPSTVDPPQPIITPGNVPDPKPVIKPPPKKGR